MTLPASVALEQSNHWEPRLKTWAKSQTFPSSLVIEGSPGVGVLEVSEWIAKTLLCLTSPEGACGICSSCQHFESQTHLDFLRIESTSETDSKRSPIGIQDLEFLKSQIGFSPSIGPRRVVLVHPAETLTLTAGNSLLKLVEEPPLNWHFLFGVHDYSKFLPTLQSRCQRLSLPPLTQEALARLLASNSSLPLEAAEGNLDRAKKLTDESFLKFQSLIEQFCVTPKTHLDAVMDIALKNDENLGFLLDFLEFRLRKDLLLNPTSQHFFNIAQKIDQGRKWMPLPLNRKLWVQELLCDGWFPR